MEHLSKILQDKKEQLKKVEAQVDNMQKGMMDLRREIAIIESSIQSVEGASEKQIEIASLTQQVADQAHYNTELKAYYET